MRYSTKNLLNTITEGIQEKKGHNIVVVDLKKVKDCITQYFIICQANTANQIEAIARSINENTIKKMGEKALAVSGLDNAYWVAIDYGDVIVHILQPSAREFYDLEHLWSGAKITEIADNY